MNNGYEIWLVTIHSRIVHVHNLLLKIKIQEQILSIGIEHKNSFRDCRKKPIQTMIFIPAIPDFLKSRPFHFSVTFSGHNYLVFQGDLT